jgi:hypothetical protein
VESEWSGDGRRQTGLEKNCLTGWVITLTIDWDLIGKKKIGFSKSLRKS